MSGRRRAEERKWGDEMWWFLVLLGVLIALAGLAVIALGVSIYVSTFGNTLITTGAVAASGGFVITAMGLVLRQLERLSVRIERGVAGHEHAGEDAPAAAPAPLPAPAPAPAALRGPARGSQPRLSAEDLLPPETEEDEAPAPERAPARSSPLLPTPEPSAEAADPMLEARRQRLERRGEIAPRSAPRPPAARTGYEPPPRPAPARPAPEAPQAPAAAPPPRRAEPEEPRILKSGIVGGMAYTLYSDGSIQADLPNGVVRFASLQELRDHVSQSQNEN